MKDYAVISADIIGFTALNSQQRMMLREQMEQQITSWEMEGTAAGFYGRIVGGDQIECVLPNPSNALRMALKLKSWVKFQTGNLIGSTSNPRIRALKQHGVRIALAIAPLEQFDRDKGIIDGDAIYMSGRRLKNQTTSNKQKLIIKQTLYFCSRNEEWDQRFSPIFALLDALLSRASAKQCEVLYLKLNGLSEKEIAVKTRRTQHTISRHSTAAAWHAIEETVQYFESCFSI